MRLIAFFTLIVQTEFIIAQNLIANNEGVKTYSSFADAILNKEESNEMVEPVASINVEETVAIEDTTSISIEPAPASISTAPIVEKMVASKGTATWMDISTEENLHNFYALHKYAPIGTTVQLINPMNGQKVEVKVIGKLPQSEIYKGVVILVSAAAARQLKILDRRFIVELRTPVSAINYARK